MLFSVQVIKKRKKFTRPANLNNLGDFKISKKLQEKLN